MRCFVIGDNDMIIGFRLVGIEGIEVTTVEEAKQALNKVYKQKDVGIILISQEFSTKISQEITKLRATKMTPLIVEILGRGGAIATKMSDLISKTLGIKI